MLSVGKKPGKINLIAYGGHAGLYVYTGRYEAGCLKRIFSSYFELPGQPASVKNYIASLL